MTKGRNVPPRETAQQVHGRYLHHLHRMQAGVAMRQHLDPMDGTPKYLRVGINTAKVEHGALVKLLVQKGLITDEEYLTAIADATEAEADQYEQELSERLGRTIKLGSLY
jgi:hypothetical protein